MCGIAGFASQEVDRDRIVAESLRDSLARRGPDGGWHLCRGGFDLIQTRLAVVDLSDAVTYPLPNEAGDVWLLFNGEIYNHDSLRAELESRGHQFLTRCDAEVVVHGYEQWGDSMFGRLNGMFAIALIDQRRDEVVLARDQFGIKPLTRTDGGRFAFSSDAISLVRAGLARGEIDPGLIAEFTAFHYLAPPATGLVGLTQVTPGTAVVRAASGAERTISFQRRPFEGDPQSEVVGLDQVDDALRNAVRRQLRADVDVGVLLSSGIDSALLLSYAVELGVSPRAYTLSFAGHGDYDESAGAAAVASSLGVSHEVEVLSMDFDAAASGVGMAYDQPFADSSAIATLQLSALARRRSTVVLSGTGSDELFGGYYRTRAHRPRAAANVVSCSRARAVRPSPRRGGDRASLWNLGRSYAERLTRADSATDLSQYLSIAGRATSADGWETLLAPGDPHRAGYLVADRLGLSERIQSSPMQALQAYELETFLPGDLLTKEDRATMTVGLEGRVPFLDDEVVALAARLPVKQRASLLQGKKPLRALVNGRFGSIRISAAKRGFAVPLSELFTGAWRRDAVAWLDGAESQFVDTAHLSRKVNAGLGRAADTWAQVALVAWEQQVSAARASARRIGTVESRS